MPPRAANTRARIGNDRQVDVRLIALRDDVRRTLRGHGRGLVVVRLDRKPERG